MFTSRDKQSTMFTPLTLDPTHSLNKSKLKCISDHFHLFLWGPEDGG